MKLSVVIPCYRSENTIRSVVNEITETMSLRSNVDYEIILVNDCSPDNVWNVISTICDEDKHIIGLNLSKNFGQHSALMAGYNICSGDYIISLDDDGQSAANELFVLVDKIEEGYDVVYADYPEKKENKFRLLGSYLNKKMNEIMIGKPKEITPNSYFIMKSYIVSEIIKYQNAFPYVDGLIFRTTNKISKVNITHRSRIEGTSGYSLAKLISLWINGFTAFSLKPLRFATWVGSITAIIGFICGVIFIIIRLFDTAAVTGWTSLISVILFTGGMNMLLLGLIGEYLGRVYLCINASPQYVIKESKNLTQK